MENSYGFSIQINGDEAAELKQTVDKALAGAGLLLPKEDPWQYEGPPEGAFGFGEGVLVFLGDAWKELAKVPGAVLALAEGVRDYLKNRPNASLTFTTPEGKKIVFKANMNGNDMVEAVKYLTQPKSEN
jgi:hypothetical protein